MQNRSDNITDVNIVWEGPRGVHSFRCNNKLWKAFVSEIKARGDSVCHYMEAIIAAVITILRQNVYTRNTMKANSVPSINVTIKSMPVQRVVKKHRRLTHDYEPEANLYHPKLLTWVHETDAVLNDNGHAVGCACKVCRSAKGGKAGFRIE